ncbi:MAG: HAMP domain-containing sensor histidine kinase [Eggerthellaceae bacterium]|jgi:signal transduction histidine kinase
MTHGRQAAGGAVNFKHRIAVSNAVMILVPAAAALVCALVCVLVGWNTLLGGSGIDDSSDFQQAGLTIDAAASQAFCATSEDDATERYGRLDALLNARGMDLIAESSDGRTYEHDARSIAESSLISQARSLGDSGYVQSGTNAVRVSTVEADGTTWRLYLQGTVRPQTTWSNLKTFAVTAVLVVVAAVIVSALLANRFVSRFLIRTMEKRLDALETGLAQLNGGNLSYRIDAVGDDEFKAVCSAFNRMADALETSMTAVHEQNARRARLVADVSHDLRTPLASIKGYAEGIRDGIAATPAARERYVTTIVRKTDEMSALLDRMLSYSKLDLGESEVQLSDERIDEVVAVCAADYEGRLAVRLDVEPVIARVDKQLLQRVVANILDNSVKYGTKTPAPVRIRVGAEGGDCVIEVADEGTKVTADEASSLFDLFYRADAARASTSQGNGIGLAFVKRAVQGMGGSVAARPNGDAGLVVTVKLPRKDTHEEHSGR